MEAQPRDEKLRVVATLPDLADLARAIGGERIEVETLARPGQNLHAVRVKPSHLVALSKADLFLQVGLSLEHAWVPGLIQTARNREVLPGTDGFVSAGEGFTMIEVPVTLDRGQAVDVHPLGNPHVNLSMNGGLHMAERVRDGLIRVDPEGETVYRAGFETWKRRQDEARLRWSKIAEAIAAQHREACLYHREFDYLLGELGLPIAAFLEPRPGLPPTPSHLADVIETVKTDRIPVVLTAPWSNNKNCAHVARATGASVLELPVMVGGGEGQMTWIDMMDRSIRLIAEAYGVDVEAALAEPVGADKQRASRP
ncbi:putative periplasmic iron-binding protein precursor [Planctomycetes bacterium Poly30]|uniref:Putative periplasmic iron-binding protein n=2 Tax=Saltatorellus ferox TaxID=2528018 RepID=A0A518EX88_9BACT|nr:putative periplasmic iron-binding protein precursor [Planctomycetes bacterium Poly30]